MIRGIAMSTLMMLAISVHSSELQHQFNSPAFSGQGYSSHVLTLKQLEDLQKDKNKALADTLKAKAESEALNTPQAKFLANLEARIYSQLAKQLTDSMFGEGSTCTTKGVVCGSIPDLGGNNISWKLGDGSDNGLIIITITSNSNPAQTTTMKVPAGTFYF
jgi:Type VIII secretion system (T8SS), CsgF protein